MWEAERKTVYLHAQAHSVDAGKWWDKMQLNDEATLQNAAHIDAATCRPDRKHLSLIPVATIGRIFNETRFRRLRFR